MVFLAAFSSDCSSPPFSAVLLCRKGSGDKVPGCQTGATLFFKFSQGSCYFFQESINIAGLFLECVLLIALRKFVTLISSIRNNYAVTGILPKSEYQQELSVLRGNNRDLMIRQWHSHEHLAGKLTPHHFKLFRDYPNSPCSLKEGDFGWS